MREYPRTGQIEAFRAVRVGSTVLPSSTVTRVDPSPDPQRRRIRLSNQSSEVVYVKLANVTDSAPSISSGSAHYRLLGGAAVDIDIGPEVAVYAWQGGLSNVTLDWVEF